eukprot:1332870-Amorphochlora_amoeboformis.AAC.2
MDLWAGMGIEGWDRGMYDGSLDRLDRMRWNAMGWDGGRTYGWIYGWMDLCMGWDRVIQGMG